MLLEEFRIPEDSFLLYASDSSFQGPNVREAYSKSPPNIYLDVEDTTCQILRWTPTENVSHVSDVNGRALR